MMQAYVEYLLIFSTLAGAVWYVGSRIIRPWLSSKSKACGSAGCRCETQST